MPLVSVVGIKRSGGWNVACFCRIVSLQLSDLNWSGLDSLGGGNVVDVVAESDKQVKEQLRASVVHLELHSSATLEGTARADDEGEIVGSQLRVCVGSVGVGVSGRGEDGAALDTRFFKGKHVSWFDGNEMERLTESLFAKCQLLQLIQPILFSRTVNDSILEKITIHTTMIDSALDCSTLFFSSGLNLPRVASLVVHQTRVVVTLVEILEHRAKDLGLLVGKGDALGGGVHVPVSKSVAEEGAATEDVFVSGKEALFSTDDESDDGRSQVADDVRTVIFMKRDNGYTYFPMAVSSLAVAVEAVVGLRWRDSCRRLVTPLSLLKEELDLLTLWLLEKLLLEDSCRLDEENMLAAVEGISRDYLVLEASERWGLVHASYT